MVEQASWIKTYTNKFVQNAWLYNLVGFLIWPFGFTLAAFRYWDNPWSKNVFWLFCVFFGYTFIISDLGWADSGYYAYLFNQYTHTDPSLKTLWRSFYSVGSGYDDIASPLITFLISRFTSNPSILFAVFGLIFGYFYSRNIWYVLERTTVKPAGFVILYMLTFIFLNSIWNINGFRYYVAAQMFLFGVLPFLVEGKKTRLVWAVVSFFFHFSFSIGLGILLLFLLIGNRRTLYLGFFIVSAFIREINLEFLQSYITFLPEIFSNKVVNYTNPQAIEALSIARQTASWFVTFSITALRWSVYAAVLFIFLVEKNTLNERKDLSSLFSFSLLFFGFANVVSLIPSGSRFILVSGMFMFAFLIFFFSDQREKKGIRLLRLFTIPLLTLFLLVSLRMGMDFFGVMTLIGNPITVLLYSDHVPLIEAIKSLF